MASCGLRMTLPAQCQSIEYSSRKQSTLGLEVLGDGHSCPFCRQYTTTNQMPQGLRSCNCHFAQ